MAIGVYIHTSLGEQPDSQSPRAVAQRTGSSSAAGLRSTRARPSNRRAKFYRLTAKGRRQLEVETSKWDMLARAVGRILRPAAQE